MSPRVYILAGTHLAALALGAWGFNLSVHQPHLHKDRIELDRVKEATRKIEQAGVQLAIEARDTNDTKQETVRYVTQETIRAVPVYVPEGGGIAADERGRDARSGSVGDAAPQDRSYSLTVGFGRLHDYAALGAPVPPTPSEPLDSPSGVTLPALAETLAGNYSVCHLNRTEVETWRAWYVAQAGAWGKR